MQGHSYSWGLFLCVPVKKVFSQPQKIQQLTCVCFALRHSQDCGCSAEMPPDACGCWSAILRAFMNSGLHSVWFQSKLLGLLLCCTDLSFKARCQQASASLEILAYIS